MTISADVEIIVLIIQKAYTLYTHKSKTVGQQKYSNLLQRYKSNYLWNNGTR